MPPPSSESSMRPPTVSVPTRRLSQVSSHLSSSSSPPPPSSSKTPRRALPPASSAYRYFLPFQSTWRDNDQYQHFNNTVYAQYFDMKQCGLNSTSPIGLIVHSETSYNSQLSYPEPIIAALSISTLSPRKIVWKIALFKAEEIEGKSKEGGEVGMRLRIARDGGKEVRAAAWGTMTHVFVEREGRKKVVEKLPEGWEDKLRELIVEEGEEQ